MHKKCGPQKGSILLSRFFIPKIAAVVVVDISQILGENSFGFEIMNLTASMKTCVITNSWLPNEQIKADIFFS